MKSIKNQKTYKVLRPETFGLLPDAELTFVETQKGYVATVSDDIWIGFPKQLIEQTPAYFKYQRKHNKKNGTVYEIVGRNRTPTPTH